MFSATNPISGIRADLCVVLLVQLKHMVDVGIDSVIVSLSRAFANVVGIELMKWPEPTLRETGSATHMACPIYAAGGCLSLSLDYTAFSMEGPEKGVIEKIT